MYLNPNIVFGTLREHYIMLFGAAGAFATVSGFVGAWVGARMAARSTIRRIEARRPETIDAAQIRNLVDGIVAIALEVERISEAQRFVARLLSERHAPAPLPAARRTPGEITPH